MLLKSGSAHLTCKCKDAKTTTMNRLKGKYRFSLKVYVYVALRPQLCHVNLESVGRYLSMRTCKYDAMTGCPFTTGWYLCEH